MEKPTPEALRASPRRGAAADRQSRIRAAPWAQWITDVMTYTNGAAGRAGRQESVFDLGRLSDLKRDVKHDPDGTAQQKQVAKQFEALFLQMMLKRMREATPRKGCSIRSSRR